MEKEQLSALAVLILIIFGMGIWGNYKIQDLSSQIEVLENENADLQYEIEDFQKALEEANNNIEEANSYLEDAQGYAWSSYEEMGEALEGLGTVDTVSKP